MVDFKKLIPDANARPYYLMGLAFALLALALFLGLEKAYSAALVIGLLTVSMTLFAVVMLTILKLPKALQPETHLPDVNESKASVEATSPSDLKKSSESKSGAKSDAIPIALPGSESKSAVPPANSGAPATLALTYHLEPSSGSKDENSRLKTLMNTPLGEILVTGLLSNPEQLAQIIVQAVTQAKSGQNAGQNILPEKVT